jgi:DNA-nicking Smr family endonuclease
MTEMGDSKNNDLFSADEWQDFLDDIERATDKVEGEKEFEEQAVDTSDSLVANCAEYALEIDLHGLNLEDAKMKVVRGYQYACSQISLGASGKVLLRIITGKGRHSDLSGAVLPAEIYDFVSKKWNTLIQRIDPPPEDAKIGGLPVKGHFDVCLNTK